MAFPMKMKAAAAGPGYPKKMAPKGPAMKKTAMPKKGVAKTLGSQFMAEGANC